jgi:hypothetical protein
MEIREREVVRFLHILFCLVIMVLRLALIFLSVAIRVNLFHLNAFLYDYVTVLVFYLVSSSCAYISLGVFGICAAATLRRWMFVAYAAILAILYLVEVIIFGLTLNKWLTYNVTIEESVDYHISNYRTNPHDINYIQETLPCCGKYREDEWFDVISYIPASCCPSRPSADTNEFCSVLPPDISYITHNKGCLRLLQDVPRKGLVVITSLLICLCVVEVLSFCVSTYAARWTLMAESIKTASNTKEYEGTNRLAKITFIYDEKGANSEDASVQCIFLRPIASEEWNTFGA